MTQQAKPVSIWDVAPPPYEQYLYVMADFDERHGVAVMVGLEVGGFRTVQYAKQETARAESEAKELSALIASTRSLLGLQFHPGVQLL